MRSRSPRLIRCWLRADRGAATLESAICVTLLFMLVGLTAAWGLTSVSGSVVDNAAKSAARAASMAPDAATAAAEGRSAAHAALQREGSDCTGVSVTVDTSGFTAALGDPAQVAADVTCTVPLTSVVHVPGLPGSKTLTASFASPLDPYAERS